MLQIIINLLLTLPATVTAIFTATVTVCHCIRYKVLLGSFSLAVKNKTCQDCMYVVVQFCLIFVYDTGNI